MAVDLVAVMTGAALEEIDVDIVFELPGELGDQVKRARRDSAAAEQAQRKAAEGVRAAVARILGSGMSKQDAARILGVRPSGSASSSSRPRPRPTWAARSAYA